MAFEESPECEDVEAAALVWHTPWAGARLFESGGKVYAGEGAGGCLVQRPSYSASATKALETLGSQKFAALLPCRPELRRLPKLSP